jgi:large subunit ribosomal protein L9
MKVILKEEVKNLGGMGDMVDVKEGFARNHLLPKRLAVVADMKNLKALEHEKRIIAEKAKKLGAQARSLGERLSAMTLTIKAKAGEEEKLFGSVTTMDIEEALKAEGMEVERKKIILDEPIKRLGSYTVKVKVHPDVTTELNINVVAE